MSPRIERVTFPGSGGDQLAARLDLPAGLPKAYALFAHCFTCGKDIKAASHIAAALTDLGFAVMRVDFTGLGASEGEFGNTDFTSNVGDLLAAVDWMRKNHAPPQLVIGHSLGGAAAILAGAQIAETRAVVTIGAPSSTEHVTHLFADDLDKVNERGAAEVNLFGRTFCIGKQMVDDLRRGHVIDAVRDMDKAILVMHSPVDEIVSAEHAHNIFRAAQHPRSFVSLDDADHLLTGSDDAEYVASVVNTWAGRYLVDESGAEPAPDATSQVVVAETTQGTFLNHVVAGRHRFLADEPVHVGGFDAGPAPYDLLAAALGTCTSMTLRLYADRKKLPASRFTVEVSHDKVHLDDADSGGKIDQFTRTIHFEGDLNEGQQADLLRIADKCPVHRTLEATSQIVTRLGSPS